ncbi:MAG: replicative DNA helicase [Chlamydiota bacterium]
MAIKKTPVKIPPHSKESEMMVLGCMLTSINSLNFCSDSLREKDFYFLEHQIIFSILQASYKEDRPADIHIVAESLKKEGNLKKIGGVSYLTTLAQYAGTSAYVEEYVKMVREKAILRSMVGACEIITSSALQEKSQAADLLDEAQAKFYEISQTTDSGKAATVKEILSGVKAESNLPYLKELQARQERYLELGPDAAKVTGIPTKFTDIDKLIQGFHPSNFMILAARPAMGKTALAINIAENICFKQNIPVAVFSLEMSASQLVHRLICSHSEVESDKILSGAIDGSEYQRIFSSVQTMQKHVMVIDDQPGLKITDLRSRARRMKEAYNIGFMVIDYLQLLSGSGTSRSQESRQLEISEISRLLKTLARELNIPILCLSQLSRKVEERQGHRPLLSDLRESGSLEQDSDLILFLLRREYYDPYDKPGMAELIVAKNRHGAIGTVPLVFRKEFAQFKDYVPIETVSSENDAAFAAFTPDE